jgi:hypothetical protein
MKKIFPLIVLMLLGTSTLVVQAKQDQPSTKDVVKNDNVTVVYYRPYKQGRVIFGDIVPYGKVWCTGDIDPTTVEFVTDCEFDGRHVKKGSYVLTTVPGERKWTVTLTPLNQPGAGKSKATIHATALVTNIEDESEQFTIAVEPNALVMTWDKTSVRVPMKF